MAHVGGTAQYVNTGSLPQSAYGLLQGNVIRGIKRMQDDAGRWYRKSKAEYLNLASTEWKNKGSILFLGFPC